jgi:hypothetical protein
MRLPHLGAFPCRLVYRWLPYCKGTVMVTDWSQLGERACVALTSLLRLPHLGAFLCRLTYR